MIKKEQDIIDVPTTGHKNVLLSVFSLIKQGKSQKEVSSILNISERHIRRYYKDLRLNGVIEKLGYGVWEVKKEQDIVYVDNPKFRRGGFKKVRSHNFGFYLKIPMFSGWSKREEFLQKKGVVFTSDNINRGQRFIYKGYHVFLYKRGIRFLLLAGFEGFLTDSATLGNELAIRHVLGVVKGLENLFGVRLSRGGKYSLRITKQHHALVRNELASLYNKNREKLQVFDERGLWLLVDDSFDLDELECVHGVSASGDMDNAVKPFFNDLKKNPVTLSEVVGAIGRLAEYNEFHAKNIESHIKSIQIIGKGVDKWNSKIDKLIEIIDKK